MDKKIKKNKEDKAFLTKMVNYRQHFHQYPELAFKEYKTAEYILQILNKLTCFEVKANVGGTGILASFTKNPNEKYIGFRADMDALPIQEETGLEFASKHDNVSHACGHDLHMSILLTFAEYIHNNQDNINCNIKLLFQPAEEIDEGARAMIADNVLENIEEIYGFHVLNSKPFGTVIAPIGVVMGATDEINITIEGKSGHGAEPFKAYDPIIKAAQIIQELSRIKSHQITPYEPSSLTICSIKGGEAFNVIPKTVTSLTN